MAGLYDRNAVAEMITAGKMLLLAADEKLLGDLPRGDWIGGTIPYFMVASGGIHTASQIFVTELPAGAGATIRRYDAQSLSGLAGDHPGHGFTVLLIPAFTDVHTEYAENVAHYPGIFDRPVVGWISGIALEDIGKVAPRVFDGITGRSSSEHAVALHVELPDSDHVSVDIINLFKPGTGDTIVFTEKGFTAGEALVNGTPTNLAHYWTDQAIDTKLPLAADYNGAFINVSIQDVDLAGGKVAFYAPVFPGITYRVAAPVEDYVSGFSAELHPDAAPPAFSCNCILNYFYAGLEGRSTAPLLGPMTFGEIAYMLLNQTAVYLNIESE
jgi:hypothetical protein